MCRYVERNALRAGLVKRAEQWRWSSLWRRQPSAATPEVLLAAGPLARPAGWLKWVNEAQSEAEVEALRRCVQRGQPYGSAAWCKRTAIRLGLESTFQPRGRPPKEKEAGKGS